MGFLQDVPDRSRFAQSMFLCNDCVNDFVLNFSCSPRDFAFMIAHDAVAFEPDCESGFLMDE
eukprot:2861001-Heterocapsa_arctica.AAC.1